MLLRSARRTESGGQALSATAHQKKHCSCSTYWTENGLDCCRDIQIIGRHLQNTHQICTNLICVRLALGLSVQAACLLGLLQGWRLAAGLLTVIVVADGKEAEAVEASLGSGLEGMVKEVLSSCACHSLAFRKLSR